MKKNIAAVLISLCVGTSSWATLIAFDNFDYPDGSLVGNGGWIAHSGTPGDLLVSSGQVVVQHGTPSEDANIGFAPVAGNVYFGFDFSLDDLTAPVASAGGTDFEYFVNLRTGGGGFSARVDVVAPTGSGDFSVGIATADSTADSIWATDLNFDTTYRAILRYDQTLGESELWINATVSGDTSIMGDMAAAVSIAQFAFRQSDSTENETVRVDSLVIGTTFEDVASAIPEPSSLALWGLGALLLRMRRRS